MVAHGDGALARFTRDLVKEAREGRLEPVRCRADEISRVVDILLRHGKNNPALVGPAGVGKTAIVEGLAQRLAVGDVPLSLRGHRILAVDHVSLLAGTTYRGQYEERIRILVEETSAQPDVILFVDELHNLIGQGTAMGVAMDAANMLKPALVRGDFRVVGATTEDEYQRWVMGDPALERRFQRVLVRELSADETTDILETRRERLERHHNVRIADGAVRAAVVLTDRFPMGRMRPDRAIDVLDEACAHTHAVASYGPRTEELIARRREILRRRAGADQGARDEYGGTEGGAQSAVDEHPLDRATRSGFEALERLGAGIESLFSGETAEAPRPRPAAQSTAPAPERRPAARPGELAEIEAELASRLVEEGIVVRGHDVARVVSIATGTSITWVD